jgi:hypothetical protein
VKNVVGRSVALLMMATLGFVGLGSAGAGAVTAHATTSFVGVYKIHGTVDGSTDHLHGTLTVNADGTAVSDQGDVAHWTSSGETFTMVFKGHGIKDTFVADQTKKGIGSKKQPGTWSTNPSGLSGTWWGALQR